MKIVKLSPHHIRFDTGEAIKISPASFTLAADMHLLEAEFKAPLVFSETPGGFTFGNLPHNLYAVPVRSQGVSTQAAVYWQGRNVLELDFSSHSFSS